MSDNDKDKGGNGKVIKSVTMERELAKAIDDLRAMERPIPNFSDMAAKLLRKAVEAENKA